MVNTPQCPVCGQDVHTSNQHKDCRAAMLEDLLLQVQKHIRDNPRLPLPKRITALVSKQTLTPLDTFVQREYQRQQRLEKELAVPYDLSRFG